MLDAMTILLGFSDSWMDMHYFIQGMADDEGQLNQDVLDTFVRYYVFGVYNSNGLAASVISKAEMSDGLSDAESCRLVNEKLTAEGQSPETWLINECRLLAGMNNEKWTELLKNVASLGVMKPVQLKESLEENPELPFFLYSGEKDVFVPIETFTEEVKTLGARITYRQFPNTGHEGFYAESQVWADILSIH
jgi:hypothetical protein